MLSEKEVRKLSALALVIVIFSFFAGFTVREGLIPAEEVERSPPPVSVACTSGYVNETIWNQAWYGPVNSTTMTPPAWHNDSFIAILEIYAHLNYAIGSHLSVGMNVSYSTPAIWYVTFDAVHAYFVNESDVIEYTYSYNVTGELTATNFAVVYFFGHGELFNIEGIIVSGIVEVTAWWIQEEVEG